MKKHLSVFMLTARFALLPTLIVSVLGAAGTFAYLMSAVSETDSEYMLGGELFSHIALPVYVGVALLFLLLMRALRERGGVQPGYTMRRLGVSELTAFVWQSVTGAAAFFIFMMAQAAVCLGCGLYLQNQGYGLAGDMSLVVGFVNGTFSHAMLPMGDLPVYLRMAMVYLTLGASTAYSSFMSRRGKTAISPFVVLAAALLLMGLQAEVAVYGYEVAAIVLCALILFGYVVSVRGRSVDDDDAETEAVEA